MKYLGLWILVWFFVGLAKSIVPLWIAWWVIVAAIVVPLFGSGILYGAAAWAMDQLEPDEEDSYRRHYHDCAR